MGTETAGEEAVAVAYLHHIAGADITHGQHTGHTLGPHVEVVLSVGANYGLAGGAAGGVDTLYFAHRHCLQTEGIFITEVILSREGQLGHVIHTLYIVGRDTQFIHLPLIEGDLLVASLDCLAQPLALQSTHIIAAHALHLGIVNHCFFCVW